VLSVAATSARASGRCAYVTKFYTGFARLVLGALFTCSPGTTPAGAQLPTENVQTVRHHEGIGRFVKVWF